MRLLKIGSSFYKLATRTWRLYQRYAVTLHDYSNSGSAGANKYTT